MAFPSLLWGTDHHHILLPCRSTPGPTFKPVAVQTSSAVDAYLEMATYFGERGLQSYCGPMMVLGQDILSQRDMWAAPLQYLLQQYCCKGP